MKNLLSGTLIISILLIGIVYTLYTNKILKPESFIVTVSEYVLGAQCPDYCAYDGHSYYLVFNNKEFDGTNNPLVFDSINDVKLKCKELECPYEHYIQNMIILNRKTNHDDPQEDLERRCAKQIALNRFSIDKCAFNYAYSSPDLIKEFTSVDTRSLSAIDNNSLDAIESTINSMNNKNKDKALDNYKMIRQLVEFINQNDESVMVDYDLETCMFEKVGQLFNGQPSNRIPQHLRQQDLGTTENLHKFRKHFESSGQEFVSTTGSVRTDIAFNDDTQQAIVEDSLYLDEDSMKGFISYFNEANNVIEDHVIDKVFDEDDFVRDK